MRFSEIELPSNRKFGLFFAGLFIAAFGFLLYKNVAFFAWFFAALSIVFTLIAMTKPNILLPLNKLWMRFGLLLGMIVSPIVLGMVFFLIFTPVGLVTRMFGRDELRLKPVNSESYWKQRELNQPTVDSFTRQY